MARTRERVFATVVAVLFICTSIGGSAFIIYQIYQDKEGAKQPTASATGTNTKKLEGTMLDNFTPVEKVDSLQVLDLQPGTGSEVKAGDTITFDYTGALATTGKIFQSSLDTGQAVTYPLNQLIQGWQQGIPGMKVGGKRRLLIPSELAYGSQEQPGIPANSDLVFDITVDAIGQ